MLHISDELKTAFLSDTVKKNIEIEFEPTVEVVPDDFSQVNFYDTFDVNSSPTIITPTTEGSANDLIRMQLGNQRIMPLWGTNNYNTLKKYERSTKYVYLDFNLWFSNFSGIETPASIELYVFPTNAGGSGRYVKFFEGPFSTSYIHVTGYVELNNHPIQPDDLCYFVSEYIYVKFIKSTGEYTSSDIVSFNSVVSSNVHVTIGNDLSAFPYTEDIQIAYNNLNFDDYVTYTEKPDKYSLINFWKESNPFSATKATKIYTDSAPGFGISFEEWAINDYITDATAYKFNGTYKIISFTPISGVDAPYQVWMEMRYKLRNGNYAWYTLTRTAFDTNVSHDFSFSSNVIHWSDVPTDTDIVGFDVLGIWFIKPNNSYYTIDEIESLEVEFSGMNFNIGTFYDVMPYSDTVQVEYHGYNINDYLIEPPVDDSFTLYNEDLIKESFMLTESISGSDKLKFGATESAVCEFESPTIVDKDLFGRYFRAYITCEDFEEKVSLGRFRVKNVTKRGAHSLITKRIQAYDGIYPLSRSGSSWYTNYMGLAYNIDKTFYGLTQRKWTAPRQMFSTLYNVLKSIDIELPIENISAHTVTLYDTSQVSAGQMLLKERAGSDYYNSDYVAYSSASKSTSPSKMYRVRIEYNYKSVLDEYFEEVGYRNHFGMYPSRGGIIIAERLDSYSGPINMFSVNDGDWFAVSPNTYEISILVPSKYHIWSGDEETLRLRELTVNYPSTIYVDDGDFDLFSSNNFAVRLVYYNWQTYELGQPMSTNYRDIIRSLVEITGHFFRYGRDGNIEFIKGEIAGLYPSNELYPADNLYPRGGFDSEVIPMGKYRSFECDDKETNHFGRVQILLSAVNENEPSTRNYTGDATKKNVYVMTDNVFYCASGVSYAMKNDGTDPLPELTTMLSNMYNVISSMYYIPCEVEAYGMPWFECGDRIGLLTDHGGFETFIFKRTLQGIQYLTDDYEALGDENTDSIIDAWN